MMPVVKQHTKNVEVVAEAHKHFNRHDLEASARNAAEDFTYTDQARGISVRGRDGFVEWMSGWKKAFSDARIDEPEYIDAGDAVVTRFTGRGTNDGPLEAFPASGKQMDVPMCEIVRFNEAGLLASGEIFYDQMSILTQLGHVEPPPSE